MCHTCRQSLRTLTQDATPGLLGVTDPYQERMIISYLVDERVDRRRVLDSSAMSAEYDKHA
jgi:hypothetical protein